MALWLLLNRTRVGMMIRAGVDDRAMLAAAGVNVNLVFATTFAIGAGLAGLGGVIGAVEFHGARRGHAAAARVTRRGDRRRHGQRGGGGGRRRHPWPGRDDGLAYAPTYSVVFTFVILVLVLAFRPRGILGRPA